MAGRHSCLLYCYRQCHSWRQPTDMHTTWPPFQQTPWYLFCAKLLAPHFAKPATVWTLLPMEQASHVALVVKNPSANAGDIRDRGSTPGLGRYPGGGNGNPLQYSCLKNPMDRRVWWATVHRVAKSWTWLKWLSAHTCTDGISPQQRGLISYLSHLHLWAPIQPWLDPKALPKGPGGWESRAALQTLQWLWELLSLMVALFGLVKRVFVFVFRNGPFFSWNLH